MIHPDKAWKRIWDLITFCATTYFAIEVPLRIVFDYKIGGQIALYERIIQILFGIDIVLNFFTGYFQERTLVTNKKLVAKRYLSSWFIIDFCSAFPFDIFGQFFYSYFGLTDSLRVLRLVRSVKVFELFRSLRMLAMGGRDDYQYKVLEVMSPVTFRLAFFIYWTSLFAHWVACGWIQLNPAFLAKSDNITRYIRSLYWSVTTLTTIGYGDITPTSNAQTIYTMGVMVVGVGIYGYVIGNISTILSTIDISRIAFQEKLNSVNSFLKYKKLPNHLSNRIRSYYFNLWENKHGVDEDDIWEDLPIGIKADVSFYLHEKLIDSVPFFKEKSEELKREVAIELKPIFFMKGDWIYREGDFPNNIYFIAKGQIEIYQENTKTVIATLNEGSFFGETDLFKKTERTTSAKAIQFCDLYILDFESLDRILKHHPEEGIKTSEKNKSKKVKRVLAKNKR
ncbi:ion transporter [Leptospira ilyithenensis]|uniref:Cyclic nucleotide-binding protein n=1 Tax=Leptospira ilyithenensis TaxID=2484901 RepID=A0A4R9LNJ2_9LEPT|nr:ion transporter [Leptospira ilyithenensis]TGN08453.1 cyclic nucleotide-binding protein [Leptospira ilyithenensis]